MLPSATFLCFLQVFSVSNFEPFRHSALLGFDGGVFSLVFAYKKRTHASNEFFVSEQIDLDSHTNSIE